MKLYLKDIAKNLNLSKTAVSLVLNNKGDENKISRETQEKIIAYVKEHNYMPNQLARGLSRGKSETIGLIIPNISDTFYSKIAGYIEAKAMERGYTVVFFSSNEKPDKESRLIQFMLNRQVDGLIIASTQKNHDDIRLLQDYPLPLVLIDRHYPDITTNYVVVDNFGGVNKATKHLLALGRRKVGFVTIKSDLEAMKLRLNGYQDALTDAGYPADEKFVKFLNQSEIESEMFDAIRLLTQLEEKVDSIIFSTHYLLVEGLRVMRNIGVKVPEDVAIISFSELAAFDLVDPPITIVQQPVKDIGNIAVELLLKEIEGKKKNEVQTSQIKLDVELVIRRSCGWNN